jgi:hypothetical protein
METLRVFSGLLGVLSVLLLFGVVRRSGAGYGLALAAAGILALYPQAVLYSRFGFSYNLLAPLVLLAFAGLYEFNIQGKARGLWLAAAAVGLGLISDLIMGAFLPVLVLVAAGRWRQLKGWVMPVACLLLALPFAVYAGSQSLVAPERFWFDLSYTFGRLGGVPPAEQLRTLAGNYMTLLEDGWWLAGLAGLFLLPRRLRGLALLFLLVPIAVVGRSEALYGLSAYYVIPLLPLVALGTGGLVRYGAVAVARRLEGHIPRTAAVAVTAVLVGAPLLTSAWLSGQRVAGRIPTAIDPFLVAGPEARAAAAFVNGELEPGELVLASPAVAWLIEGEAADFQMAVAVTGQATPHLPANLPAERWAFDPSFNRARFVIVDDLWRNWAAVHVPGVKEMLVEVETWDLQLAGERVRTYERPGAVR